MPSIETHITLVQGWYYLSSKPPSGSDSHCLKTFELGRVVQYQCIDQTICQAPGFKNKNKIKIEFLP
jgi:hypothetical protein